MSIFKIFQTNKKRLNKEIRKLRLEMEKWDIILPVSDKSLVNNTDELVLYHPHKDMRVCVTDKGFDIVDVTDINNCKYYSKNNSLDEAMDNITKFLLE